MNAQYAAEILKHGLKANARISVSVSESAEIGGGSLERHRVFRNGDL